MRNYVQLLEIGIYKTLQGNLGINSLQFIAKCCCSEKINVSIKHWRPTCQRLPSIRPTLGSRSTVWETLRPVFPKSKSARSHVSKKEPSDEKTFSCSKRLIRHISK